MWENVSSFLTGTVLLRVAHDVRKHPVVFQGDLVQIIVERPQQRVHVSLVRLHHQLCHTGEGLEGGRSGKTAMKWARGPASPWRKTVSYLSDATVSGGAGLEELHPIILSKLRATSVQEVLLYLWNCNRTVSWSFLVKKSPSVIKPCFLALSPPASLILRHICFPPGSAAPCPERSIKQPKLITNVLQISREGWINHTSPTSSTSLTHLVTWWKDGWFVTS